MELPRLPVGTWFEGLVDWLTDNASWLLDLISTAVETTVQALTDLLTAPPALLLTERCRGNGESFVNRFWADPETGGIYRSEQWIGPQGPLWVEVVNPPAS